MKKDIMAVVLEFFRNKYLDWRLNTTFVALIPKKEGEKEIKDFLPISLLSGIYKIIGKMMASRLCGVINSLVSEFQFGGIPDRNIHEGILIANELVDSYVKNKKSGILFKIDFRKAFDTVSWDFLQVLLEKFGFGNTWRKWLETIWKSSRFSVLIGGAPEGFFSSTRGLRQGDPLSPLLFSLVAEALSLLLIKADILDLIRGFSFSSNDVRVNSLQYADDTLALVDGPFKWWKI